MAITRSFIFQEIDFGSFSGVVIERDFKCFTLIYEMAEGDAVGMGTKTFRMKID